MRILVVEDDPRLAHNLKRGLEDELHTVDVAEDGLEAMDYSNLILEATYDVIVLDVLLPGQDGLAVCRHWRSLGVRTPVLMLTARREVDNRVEGLDAGADDYLTKPFAFAELIARVRALGRREPGLREDALVLDDLRLDPVSHRVERGGRVIDVTPREYRILELLLRHPGQVMSRDQIADRAWDLGAEHASNVVDVFVHTLRKKLDWPREARLVHTVRGVGYVLRVADKVEGAGQPPSNSRR